MEPNSFTPFLHILTLKHGHFEHFEHDRKSVASQFRRYSYVGSSASNEKSRGHFWGVRSR